MTGFSNITAQVKEPFYALGLFDIPYFIQTIERP